MTKKQGGPIEIPAPRKRWLPGVVLVSLFVAAQSEAQVVLHQEDTIWNAASSSFFTDFGTWVDASGDRFVASGIGRSGAQTIAAFERSAGGWQSILTSTVSISGSERGGPAAMHGNWVYRLLPVSLGPDTGLHVERWMPGNVGFTPLFVVGEPDAAADDLVASSFVAGDLGGGDVVAIAWREAATVRGIEVSQVRVYSNTLGPWSQMYADAFVGGGALSLSLTDDLLLVGVPLHDEVSVVQRDGLGWTHSQTIDAPVNATLFGHGVAAAGDRIAIGAPEAETCILALCTLTGQVYFYERTGLDPFAFWTTLVSSLDDVPANAELGASVELSDDGTRVAAGAPAWAPAVTRGSLASEGAVFVATEPDFGATWQGRGLARSTPDQTDRLGTAVAWTADGSLIAGAPLHDDGGEPRGAVLEFIEVIFADGFESGDVSAWSATP